MNKSDSRCEHRHSPQEHPNCFLPDKWYEMPGQRVGYLDIEASGLEANKSWMLSWAIKERGGKVVMDYVKESEFFKSKGVVDPNYDKRIVQSLIKEMKQYTVLIGYYSTGFDLPYIRTRAMKYNLHFPYFGQIAHIDVFYHIRSKMRLFRNSLSSATEFLDIAGKTHLDFTYWYLASMGDQKSMKELLHHNKEDVIILEQLHDRIAPYCKFTKKSV